MRSILRAGVIAATLASAACTQTTQNAPPGTTTAAAANAPQTSGTIQVVDVFTTGQPRTVSPNWASINAQPLGSKGNPVRTFMPRGQHAYLQRLVCPDGSTPSFTRIGNFGVGVYSTIIDGYDVRCGATSYTVYMDLYHPAYVERRPVPGFTIRPTAAPMPTS